jgi:hypothetical protein
LCGTPNQLLDLATEGQVDLALSEAIIAETRRILPPAASHGIVE